MKLIIKKIKILAIACLLALTACNDYLDIVPDDGIPTLESAFHLRSAAIRYLYTCYGFMPLEGSLDGDFGLMTGDELWTMYGRMATTNYWNGDLFNIARGFQNANNPHGGDWSSLYEGIRCCNILMENIGIVPDLPEWEKLQWIAEAKFLKAWYHFHLIRRFGPIPIIRENLSIDASVEEVRVFRNPIDECFDYVNQLLNEAIPDLPLQVQSRDELGRITRSAAAAVKAKVAVFAASPLFNNNTDQAKLENRNGTKLFKTDKTPEEVKARWDSAVVACRKAIEICTEANMLLYRHETRVRLNDTILQQLDLRNIITEKWNDEIIWTNTHTPLGANQNLQRASSPNLQFDLYPDMPFLLGQIQVPLKIAEMFYTDHGIPIENDLFWDTINPYELRDGGITERWYIRRNYTTVKLNFHREPRFYAWLGFDGGIWYGQKPDVNDPVPNDLFWVACRANGAQRKIGAEWGPVTGYYPKKFINYRNRQTSGSGYDCIQYPWPMLRLADLYLLYAEAINESEGPNGTHSSEMFAYIDSVRSRAGLPNLKKAWDEYSDTPGKYSKSLEDMREIIHRERLIELAFEGQRFWDLRRWKEAFAEYEKGIFGFKITASAPEDYYQKIQIADQKFGLKDYFWPIKISIIEQNPNLIQNTGW
ncbi:MAG: RagB/SusD family nutrient uptake outer membrane protein [Prevotellaceae bacterium]|nr:RagB/SusD family nutrient uptake outer membrane protein [Prevotellaceae bacterium]